MTQPNLTLTAGILPVEGGIGTYRISLDAPAPETGLTINFNTLGSTATRNQDYTLRVGDNLTALTGNKFTIAAGATTATLVLHVITDDFVEPHENVQLQLLSGTDYKLTYNTTSFAAHTKIDVGSRPFAIIAADFNHDGNVDLASANMDRHNVSIRLGNGDGRFIAIADIAVGYGPIWITQADFNNDNNLDIITADYSANSFSVRLGDGAGGFSEDKVFLYGDAPEMVVTADFNNDGNVDLATTKAYGFSGGAGIGIWLGDGQGQFAYPTAVLTGNFTPIVTADFNNDGNADLAALGYQADKGHGLVIQLGDGKGQFMFATLIALPDLYISLAAMTGADFNHDGNLDLAIANGGGADNRVLIRLGDGQGGFTELPDVAVGVYPYSITTADFNHDGKLDFATANLNVDSVSIRLGDGAGHFSAIPDIKVGNAPSSIISADFNQDGKVDLATGNYGGTTLSIRLNTSTPESVALMIKDVAQTLNGTAKQDLLVGDIHNDVLNGNAGNDKLIGNAGNDTLNGGIGNDILLGSYGNDLQNGEEGDDVLWGKLGNNTLDGGLGNDILISGNSNLLTGGDGKDYFRFISTSTSTITDFVVADDTIRLKNQFFMQLTTTGILNPDYFKIGTEAVDNNDYVIYDNITGALFYDADGNGAMNAKQIVLVGTNLALTNADFVVV